MNVSEILFNLLNLIYISPVFSCQLRASPCVSIGNQYILREMSNAETKSVRNLSEVLTSFKFAIFTYKY